MYYKKISRRVQKMINKRKKEKEERRRWCSDAIPVSRDYIRRRRISLLRGIVSELRQSRIVIL